MSIIAKDVSENVKLRFKILTPPTIEPFTAEELKIFGRIDGTDEDALIDSFIATVREAAEKYLSRALLEQTIVASFDFWPGDVVELPKPPLISITEVRTIDESGAETTYSSGNYYADIISLPGRCVINFDATPPVNSSYRQRGGYEIEYKAGYGDEAIAVPESIRNALKLWVINIYENRQFSSEPPQLVKSILDLYKVKKI